MLVRVGSGWWRVARGGFGTKLCLPRARLPVLDTTGLPTLLVWLACHRRSSEHVGENETLNEPAVRFTSRPEARGSGPEAVFRFLGSGVDFF